MNEAPLDEGEAAEFMHQLLSAIAHLHEVGICHRDLKPENIMLQSEDSNCIKLIDFGYAALYDPAAPHRMHSFCGTMLYVAPEILQHDVKVRHREPTAQGYTPAVDLWSAGVILFCLLAYHHPFEDIESDSELWEHIRSGEPDIIEYEWEYVSEDAKDLVEKLMVVDASQRLTAQQALQHPWIVKHAQERMAQQREKERCSMRTQPAAASCQQAAHAGGAGIQC